MSREEALIGSISIYPKPRETIPSESEKKRTDFLPPHAIQTRQ